MASVAAVTPVHEHVDDRAEQEEHVRHGAEDVRAVLLPQEEDGDRQEQAEAQPQREAERPSLLRRFESGLHGQSSFRHTSARRRRRALPTTETELKLMAAAAITGDKSSPKNGYSTPAAIGTPKVL